MAFDPVGELAAQPGGQELSALVGRVHQVDPEVLHAAARGLGGMAEGVDGSLRSLDRHGPDVRQAWQGRGAEALTGYLDDFGRAGTRTLDGAERIRARIDGAGQELAGMRREVDAQVSRALDAARRVRTEALADPARAPMADQLVAQALAEPTASARSAVDRAEVALGDAAAALRELAGDLSSFSRLPTPDTRPIAPLTGAGPLEWTAALPGGEAVATAPSFVDGGDGVQGIDLSGGAAAGSSGDFTDTSSLDGSSAGDASGAAADDAAGGLVGGRLLRVRRRRRRRVRRRDRVGGLGGELGRIGCSGERSEWVGVERERLDGIERERLGGELEWLGCFGDRSKWLG